MTQSKIWCCRREDIADKQDDLNQVLENGSWKIVDVTIIDLNIVFHLQREKM